MAIPMNQKIDDILAIVQGLQASVAAIQTQISQLQQKVVDPTEKLKRIEALVLQTKMEVTT